MLRCSTPSHVVPHRSLTCRPRAAPPRGAAEQAKFNGEAGAAWPAPGDRVVLRDTGHVAVVVRVHNATQLDLLTPLEVEVNGSTARLAVDEVVQADESSTSPPPSSRRSESPSTDIDADRGGLPVPDAPPPNLVVGTDADAVRSMGGHRPPPPPKQPTQRASLGAAAYGKLLPLWALDIISSQVCTCRKSTCSVCLAGRASSAGRSAATARDSPPRGPTRPVWLGPRRAPRRRGSGRVSGGLRGVRPGQGRCGGPFGGGARARGGLGGAGCHLHGAAVYLARLAVECVYTLSMTRVMLLHHACTNCCIDERYSYEIKTRQHAACLWRMSPTSTGVHTAAPPRASRPPSRCHTPCCCSCAAALHGAAAPPSCPRSAWP